MVFGQYFLPGHHMIVVVLSRKEARIYHLWLDFSHTHIIGDTVVVVVVEWMRYEAFIPSPKE